MSRPCMPTDKSGFLTDFMIFFSGDLSIASLSRLFSLFLSFWIMFAFSFLMYFATGFNLAPCFVLLFLVFKVNNCNSRNPQSMLCRRVCIGCRMLVCYTSTNLLSKLSTTSTLLYYTVISRPSTHTRGKGILTPHSSPLSSHSFFINYKCKEISINIFRNYSRYT